MVTYNLNNSRKFDRKILLNGYRLLTELFKRETNLLHARFMGYALVRPFLYFDQFYIFDLFSTSTHRLRPKLYFDQNCTSTCASRPIRNPDLTEDRSTEIEVERPKYRKGQRSENGRNTEKVELMRTHGTCGEKKEQK